MNRDRPLRVLCPASRSEAARESAERLQKDLRASGMEVLDRIEQASDLPPDLVVVLGGDGFLMETIRRLHYPPAAFFGVNFGTVGFLMNKKEILPGLVPMIESWDFQEEEHSVLAARARLEDGSAVDALAFNDFVMERMSRQSIRLRVYLDGNCFNRFAGDGFVLATAAGSTAYNIAAGGPVLHPAVQGIVITPLYPHRAAPFHSLQFSLLVPLQSRLRIVNDDLPKRSMRVVADGRLIERVEEIEVMDSGRRLRLLRPRNHLFVNTLARKFIGS
jgi:NAD+ kinase